MILTKGLIWSVATESPVSDNLDADDYKMATVKHFTGIKWKFVEVLNRVAGVCALRPSSKDDDADDGKQMRSAQFPQCNLLG